MKWLHLTTDRMVPRLIWLSGFVFFFGPTYAQRTPLSVKRLTTEFRTSPLGIDRQLPRLAWQLYAGEAGKPSLKDQASSRDRYQSAWEVLVASSPLLLDTNKADCWRSGKQVGASNTNRLYAGKALLSGATYYWKVRVWDEHGQVSAWSHPSHWTMGLLSDTEWQAVWIGDSKPALSNDSLLFGDNPAPLFRRDFRVRTGIRSAILYISGLGYYDASINGRKVGDHFLDPGWTDARKTIPYNIFDVTGLMNNGPNCLGVTLGNGWFNGLPLRLWGGLNMRASLSTGTPRFIARLVITYSDGRSQVLVSDSSWKVTDGPLIRNNNYIGSTYDARLALPGWDRPGFAAVSRWRAVAIATAPGGELEAQQQPPVRQEAAIRPVRIRSLPGNRYLVDMGRNFAGVIRLKAFGACGTRIQCRYGELLYPDGTLNVMTSVAGQVKRKKMGGAGAPDTAYQQDNFITDGKGVNEFFPAFTFHGFRYVEVTGYPGQLTPDKIEGVVLHTDVASVGSFMCSDTLFNDLQTVCRHTFLSNLFSVQSDCPHREKLGYGGDIVATSEAFMANFDMHDLYAKTVRDFADAAQADGALPETAPYVGISDEGLTRTSGPIGWGTVLPMLLYQLYQYYGDSALVEEQYDKAKAWVDFLDVHAPDHIIRVCIGDHETLDPKQVPVTSTAFFYYNVRLLQKLAELLHRDADVDRCEELARAIREAFVTQFYTPETGTVGVHTQANQAFTLYFHLLSSREEDRALDVLREEIGGKNKLHISTGIFGTKYMPEVLAEHHQSDLVCQMVKQRDFPGWGYMLAKGATTLWEHWAYSDNTFSHNHPMFGSISGWFYKYLAGIRPDTNAIAYNRIVFQPGGMGQLRTASASYRSPQGLITASWRITAGDHFRYDISVPVNATATICLPAAAVEKIYESNKPLRGSAIKILGIRDGWVFCQTGSGNYHFTIIK